MKISKTLLPAAALVALFASCQDEDFGYKASDLQYEKEFTNAFGDVDPDQDWSMAALVTANLNVGKGTAYVYTGKPGHEGSELVGIVTDGSAQFNLIKGTKQVYVMVEQNDMFTVTGYFNVVDNVINITNNPVEKGSASTRVDGEESGTTTPTTPTYKIGDKLFTQTAYSETSDWDNITYCIDGTYFFKYQNGVYSLYSKMGSMGVMPVDEEGEDAGYYFTVTRTVTQENNYEIINWTSEKTADEIVALYGTDATLNKIMGKVSVKADGSPEYSEPDPNNKQGVRSYRTRKSWDATYYKISGNTQTTDATWTVGDCATLFWAGDAVFREGEHYKTEPHKLAAYEKYNTSIEDLEKGVTFITNKDKAHIDIPFMFGATQNDNIFGYYYYTSDEEALTANRYVLYEDAQPSSNIKVDGTAVADMDLAAPVGKKTSKVTCTSRHLVYFKKNEDGTVTGTLDFPKGVKIGFFIMRQYTDYSKFDVSATSRTYQDNGWAYSDPNLNLKYVIDANGSKNNANWAYNPVKGGTTPELTRGNVHALSWTYDGRYLCGFGDQSGDFDLNDFVWWVDGDVSGFSKIRITSQQSTSWIVASEDLGGDYDYDFNDLVFALRKTQLKEDKTKATLELVPLAAGGTLNARIVYKNDPKGEIHDLIEPGSATDKPLNAEAGTTPIEGNPVLLESEIDWNADINTIIKDNIKVSVTQKKGQNDVESAYYISAYDKERDQDKNIPQMIILPSGWDWPSEETPVNEVYAGFKDWTTNASATTWCNAKNGNYPNNFVTNPLPDVEIIEEEGQEIIDPVIPGTEDQLKEWVIAFTAEIPTLYVGAATVLTIKPDSYKNYYGTECATAASNYTFTLGDPEFATISQNNYDLSITPNKVGTTTLTITYDDLYEYEHKPTTKVFTLTAEMPDLPVPEFSVPSEITVGLGQTAQFSVTAETTKVDANSISYEIVDPTKVKVKEWKGIYGASTIEGLALGTTTIKIKHAFVATKFLAVEKTITVNVVKPLAVFALKVGTAEVTTYQIYKGDALNFTIGETTVAEGVTYTCSSTDATVASVALNGKNGTITANALGTATITVTHPETDDYSATSKTIQVTVVEDPRPEAAFTVSPSTIGLEVDGTAQFTISLTKGVANSLSYTIDKPNIVEIIGNFGSSYTATQIKAKASGTAKITITHASTAEYKAHSETITVNVGTIVWGEPIDITNCIGDVVTDQTDAWGTQLVLYPVDITSMNIEWPLGGSLIVEGSGNGQVVLFDISKNYKKETYNTLNNVNPLTIDASSIANEKKFYIGCKGNDASLVNITKLSLKTKTIQVE